MRLGCVCDGIGHGLVTAGSDFGIWGHLGFVVKGEHRSQARLREGGRWMGTSHKIPIHISSIAKHGKCVSTTDADKGVTVN